jgi:glycosyltransferase involved in cell wall biosynthesis
MKISYLIAVHNEHLELSKLLKQLFQYIGSEDEIIIQGDQGKVTDEVISVVRNSLKDVRVKYVEYPLNKDFASFKNNLLNQATKEYSFLIDADELIHPNLLLNVKGLLSENPDIDLFVLPRFNVVNDLSDDYTRQMNWNVQTFTVTEPESKKILKDCSYRDLVPNIVNFNDPQQRIWKNGIGIKYQGQVHERLTGFKNYSILPTNFTNGEFDLSWCIFHIKDFQRQKRQNDFYKTLEK